MQITNQSRIALGSQKGELKDHFVPLTNSELFDPNLNICAGVRWLFQKQFLASRRLGRKASWEETIEEYKSVLDKRLTGKEINPNVMGKFKKYLKDYQKCQAES